MSLIRKKSELVYRPKIKMLIYGSAGAGKTTLALSAPKPLLLDCDNGVHRVNYDHQTDTLQVESYPQVLEVLTKEDLTPYETIVIDTGGKLLDFMAEYIIANNPKMGKANGTLTLQGFGARKVEFQAFCKLVSSLNKHLVFVAHRKSQTENDDKVRYVPLFGGSNYDDLVTELDLVGYLELDGRRRVITFDPTDRNDGKNTCNLPSTIELPVTVDEQGHGLENTFIAESVIKPYCERIEAIQEQGRMLSLIPDPVLRREMGEDLLKPLLIHDRVHGTDYVQMLEIYLETGGSIKAVAEQTFTHRNTAIYRLGNIRKLLGNDLDSTEDRLRYQLACMLLHTPEPLEST